MVCLGIVDGTIDDEYPEGNCHEAWKGLVAKFEPSTSAELIELKKKFNQLILNDVKMDPDPWIIELELLRRRINLISDGKITEVDLLIHILSNLPSEYDNLVENMECRIGSSTNEVTMNELKERLRARYSRLNKSDGDKNEVTSENVMFTKAFKGRCNKCGAYGHKAANSRLNRQQNG